MERRLRADKLLELNDLVNEAVASLKAKGMESRGVLEILRALPVIGSPGRAHARRPEHERTSHLRPDEAS
jgi:hypothetical protein